MTAAPSAHGPGYRATDGAAYERFLGRWTARLADAFCDFARLPPTGRALDVGCGTGSLALAMAAQRKDPVAAIDLAEPYVAFARGRAGAERIAFEIGDVRRLPFADGSFVAALAQLVLTFVGDPRAVAAEMRRVTRPGGVLGAAVWDFRGGLVYQRLFWDTAAGMDPGAAPARDRLFSHPLAEADGLADLWRGAGLAEVETGSLTIRMDYLSFDDYWDPLLLGQGPVGTYVQGLTPELKGMVKERVRGAYLSGSPDGPRSLTATAWAVRGIVS
ncbi:MAG TPA: class I SAM-dependent methyltransferase [Candidatus Udaeobacter sp.]|nr:class I SAM-dependent methyltransferase [Candidatus Udaeobacter sp.]